MKAQALIATFALCLVCVEEASSQSPPGTVLWTYDLGPWITSAPALAPDGTLYVGTDAGLSAVTNNGVMASNKWTFPAGRGGAPAIALDGTIYFGSEDRHLYAVNSDGTQKWAFTFREITPTPPAIAHDGTLYVSGDGILYALTPAGATKWAYTNYNNGVGSPILGADGTVYVGSGGGGVFYAFSPSGTVKWSFNPGNGASIADSAAIGSGGTIFFTSGRLNAITPQGVRLWVTTNDFSTSSPVVGQNGTVYVEGSGHTLCAVNSGGELQWEFPGDGKRYNPPATPAIDSAGVLYYCVSNSVLAVNAQGQLLWTVFGGYSMAGVYLATTSPVIGPDGTIYAGMGSKMYAIAGTNKLAGSAWPMYRQNARHTGKVEKPSLQQPKKRADGNFEFQLHAQIDQPQTVQTSTDLVSWIALTNVLVTNVPMNVVDLSASNFTSRFYRTVSP
jgi:outer membrane protein assembly factor BamB